MKICPVPLEQQPLEQYIELKRSWFFSWPTGKTIILYKNLLINWSLIFPLCLIIANGSWPLHNQPAKLLTISFTISSLLPLLLLMRQYLGWDYIFRRLISEIIEYEESGWYDGQSWEKPIDWRSKDLMIAQNSVKPIIEIIKTALKVITVIFLLGLITYNSL